MLSELNKTVAHRYFKTYETGNIDAVMEFINPNYVLHPGAGRKPMNFDERKRDEMAFFSAFSNIQATVKTKSPKATRS